MWDTLTRTKMWDYQDGGQNYGVAFSPDGTLLAVGNDRDRTVLLQSATGHVVGQFVDPHHSPVRSVTFSSDGKTIATGDASGYVTEWRLATEKEVGPSLLAARDRAVWSVAFSPRDTNLAAGSGDGYATLWSALNGRQIRRFPDGSQVYSTVFSPNGKTLVTGDADHEIVAWDLATGTETETTLSNGDGVWGLAFSPDGSVLASADDTSEVVLTPSTVVTESSAALAAGLCQEVRGNLTPAQWTRYVGRNVPYQKVCPGY
jgi:WD40 repeat protein